MAEGNTPNITPIGSGSWQGLLAEASAQLTDSAVTSVAGVLDATVGGNRARSADRQGQEAANAIRARFYQQEWDQVRKTRVMPIQERMTLDEKEYRDQMLVAERRVETFVSEEEAQAKADLLQPSQPEVIPGKSTPEGQPDGKEKMLPGPPSVNPALNPGTLGAVSTSIVPSIIDPQTGDPIAVMKNGAVNPRAKTVMDELTNAYWMKNKETMLEMMDVLGEYTGNPYISQATQNIMQAVTDQSGQAVTGKANPDDQLTWYEDRAKFQGEMEAQDIETKQKVFDFESRQAGVEATTPFARERVEKGDLPLNEGIQRKLLTNKKLTAREAKVAAHALNRQEKLELEGLTRRKEAGLQAIPQALIPYTGDWHARLRSNDRGYQDKYTMEMDLTQNTLIDDFIAAVDVRDASGARDHDAMKAALKQWQAPEAVQAAAMASEWDDPALLKWIELKANTRGYVQRAQDKAFISRISEVAHGQPAVEAQIDATMDQIIETWRAKDARGESPVDKKTGRRIIMTPDLEEEFRANKYAEFFAHTHERRPPAGYWVDPQTKRSVKAIKSKHVTKRRRAEASRRAEREVSGIGGPEHLASFLPPEEQPTARAPSTYRPSLAPEVAALPAEPPAGPQLYEPGTLKDIEVTERTFNKPLAQSIAEFFTGRDLGQHFDTNEMKKERQDKARIEAGK